MILVHRSVLRGRRMIGHSIRERGVLEREREREREKTTSGTHGTESKSTKLTHPPLDCQLLEQKQYPRRTQEKLNRSERAHLASHTAGYEKEIRRLSRSQHTRITKSAQPYRCLSETTGLCLSASVVGASTQGAPHGMDGYFLGPTTHKLTLESWG